ISVQPSITSRSDVLPMTTPTNTFSSDMLSYPPVQNYFVYTWYQRSVDATGVPHKSKSKVSTIEAPVFTRCPRLSGIQVPLVA
ncbi:MAG: hypothetical protein PVG99_06825, partial [Desulfobacteraceae bacterium]